MPLTIALTLFALTGAFVTAEPLDLDTTFDGDGRVVVDFSIPGVDPTDRAVSLVTQGPNKLVVVGTAAADGALSDFALIRLNDNGGVDPTFAGGFVTTDIDLVDEAIDATVQSDGKLVVVGRVSSGTWASNDIAVVRYWPDGGIDQTFGTNGVVRLTLPEREFPVAVEMQTNGRIVVLGSQEIDDPNDPYLADFLLIQLTSQGQLDLSFNASGIKYIDFGANWNRATDLSVLADGRIVAVGISAELTNLISDTAYGALARVLPNGAFDASLTGGSNTLCQWLGTCGKVRTHFGGGAYDFPTAVVTRRSNGVEDGNMTVSGRFGVARYLTDGSLDTTFATNGINPTPGTSGTDLAIRPDGRLVAVGSKAGDFSLALYSDAGLLESTCGKNVVNTDFAGGIDQVQRVMITSSGKIIAVGDTVGADQDFAVARYIGGGCTNRLLLSKQFAAYNLFVHPQDKVGPNWPGQWAHLNESPPVRLIANVSDESQSTYLAHSAPNAEPPWTTEPVQLQTLYQHTSARLGPLAEIFVPVKTHWDSARGSTRDPAAEIGTDYALGFACYSAERVETNARQSVHDEPHLLGALKMICRAFDRVRGSANATAYLACFEHRSEPRFEAAYLSGPTHVGRARVAKGLMRCLTAEVTTPRISATGKPAKSISKIASYSRVPR
ncbi:MAG: delta-60 repeat domain-containing protein [Pseudomonadota bacterium]